LTYGFTDPIICQEYLSKPLVVYEMLTWLMHYANKSFLAQSSTCQEEGDWRNHPNFSPAWMCRGHYGLPFWIFCDRGSIFRYWSCLPHRQESWTPFFKNEYQAYCFLL